MSGEAKTGGTAIYRGMDRQALDAAYNNGDAVADSAQWIARSRVQRGGSGEAGSAARSAIRPAAAPAPRLFPDRHRERAALRVHPRRLLAASREENLAFVAEGPRGRGINVALPGYTLAPEASLTEMVPEIRLALDFFTAQARELGFDAARIVVGGWSAGGRL